MEATRFETTAAWHESGHTLVGKFVVGNDEVRRAYLAV